MKKVEVGLDSPSEQFADAESVQSADNHAESQTGSDEYVFPEEAKEAFRGLLFLGHLEASFRFAGHDFKIRTLKEGELIKAAWLIAEYDGSVAYQMAYRAVIAAACLESVDGEAIYTPLSDTDDVIRRRFEKVKEYYPAIIDRIYEEYINLEKSSKAIVDELGKV